MSQNQGRCSFPHVIFVTLVSFILSLLFLYIKVGVTNMTYWQSCASVLFSLIFLGVVLHSFFARKVIGKFRFYKKSDSLLYFVLIQITYGYIGFLFLLMPFNIWLIL